MWISHIHTNLYQLKKVTFNALKCVLIVFFICPAKTAISQLINEAPSIKFYHLLILAKTPVKLACQSHLFMSDINLCFTAAVQLTSPHTSQSWNPAPLQTWQSVHVLADGVQQGHLVKVRRPDHVHLFAHRISALDYTWICGVNATGQVCKGKGRGKAGAAAVETFSYYVFSEWSGKTRCLSVGSRSEVLLKQWLKIKIRTNSRPYWN